MMVYHTRRAGQRGVSVRWNLDTTRTSCFHIFDTQDGNEICGNISCVCNPFLERISHILIKCARLVTCRAGVKRCSSGMVLIRNSFRMCTVQGVLEPESVSVLARTTNSMNKVGDKVGASDSQYAQHKKADALESD